MKIGGPDMGMTPMQLDAQAQANAPAPQAPAPGYREADQPGRACMDCAHYDMGQRTCNLYQFAARPHFTCDSFAPKGEAPADPMADPTQQMPPADDTDHDYR